VDTLQTGYYTWMQANEPDIKTYRATWDPSKNEVKYDYRHSRSEEGCIQIRQATRGLCYELSTNTLIKDHWEVVGRSVDYLKSVKAMRGAVEEPMNQLYPGKCKSPQDRISPILN
jgi:hypothetical protein